jgi:SAM-dependent methyltransferase
MIAESASELRAELPVRLRNVRNVNLGCGFDRREGYINVDLHAMHEPDVIADVRHLDLFATGYYDEVVAQDVLEHLPRADAQPALEEWSRILRPGGRLVLRLPNLIGLLGLFLERTSLDEHREFVHLLFGTQAYDGDWHCNGYTELLLRHALHDAGFDVASIEDRDGWLFDVVAVRTDDPQPVDAATLRFVAPRPPVPSDRLADAERALAQARSTAVALDRNTLAPTRLRGLKRAVLRVSRVVTVRQDAHNRAVDDALDSLIAHVRR